MKAGRFYAGLIAAAIALIVWTLWNRYAGDPGAAEFLAHKLGLARKVNVPVWLTMLNVHIAGASVALLTGAVNLAIGQLGLSRYRRAHRALGYVYVASVLAVVFTSGYMAPYATGGRVAGMLFNVWNLAWITVTVTALVWIKRKQFARHRSWMMRSYAFCFTNGSIHLLLTVLSGLLGLTYESAYLGGVVGTVILLPLAAEAIVRTTTSRKGV